MRWLHISDIHVGRVGPTTQQAALTSLVSAVRSALAGNGIDAIFVTGDIAYAGLKQQYDHFAQATLTPLLAIPECAGAKVLVAPGNHDVDCEKSVPIDWARMGGSRQQQFFEESARGIQLRSSRAVSFTDYSAFVRGNGVVSPDPLTEVSRPFRLTKGNDEFHVIVTNTAFLCDKEFQDREQLPAPDLSVRTHLHSIPLDSRVIVLGHHPIHWFLQQHRNPFRGLLTTHKALYVHGHTHEIETQFGPDGLTEIGFGAAYQAPQTSAPTPYYRNTFAVCELAGNDLHVAPYHWDSEFGRWVATTTLPLGFQRRSTALSQGWTFALAHGPAPVVLGVPLAAPLRGRVLKVTPMGSISAADWAGFITGTRLIAADITIDKLTPKSAPAGHAYFEYRLPAGLHYIHCISGPGTHLHRSQIEDFNTRLDTEGYQSYTLITLGTLTEDADATYHRLRTRKAIQVFAATDLATRLSSMASFAAALADVNTPIADSEFIIAAGGIPLLLVQEKLQAAWFYVVDVDGARLAESHTHVTTLRRTRPELASASYHANAGDSIVGEGRKAFDRSAYLAACRTEFGAVRYAPLATVGLRLPDMKLDEIYIETGAQAADEGARAALSRSMDDILQGAQIDGVLKEGLTRLLGAQYGYDAADRYEHTSARSLYRHHGSIAVLGDPGSGKSCFAKRELLAYCGEPVESWYERHTPVYVALAEVATQPEPYDLIAIAATLAGRRGLPLSESHIRELYAQGLLAIFLDGLDEVVSVERRSRILAAAKALIDEGRSLGNRFVLTSRPAAVHRAELPKGLYTIMMRGLTDPEMRDLAERILAARVSQTHGTLRLDITQLDPTHAATLEKFLAECRATPGIDRLARNPLFLTLLTMIYISSGTTSAKRHRVYSQAVSTLVSIRAREAGQRVLSESDLRRRLGSIALSVFRDPQGTLPTYERVIVQIKKIVDEERMQDVPRAEIEQYVQDVAEATGLLVLNKAEDAGRPETVTFMHHSFLEYYAAIGLSATEYQTEIPAMSRIPRWREIITLLAGIVSDNGDATPIITSLLSVKDSYEGLVHESTILALDCVLEGDTPPERVLLGIIARINESMTSGTMVHDQWMREQVGHRIGRILQGSQSPLVTRFLRSGIESDDPKLCAAFIDLVGHVAAEGAIGDEVTEAFEFAAGRDASDIQKAVCTAASRASALRSEAALRCIANCLGGSVEDRRVALEAIIAAPSLGSQVTESLTAQLDDSASEVAEQAARALMKVGAISSSDPTTTTWLARSLRRLAESSSAQTAREISLSYSQAALEPLLTSPLKDRKLLGIRLLPWVHDAQQFMHDKLMQFVRVEDREERVAALASIRIASGARMLLTVPDAYAIRKLLAKEYTRDVRLEAARTLTVLEIDDADIVRELVSYVSSIRDTEQYPAAVSLLAWANSDSDVVQGFLLDEAERLLGQGSKGKEESRDLNSVLMALAVLDAVGSNRLVGLLRTTVNDWKVDIKLRRRALHALVSTAPLSVAVKVLSNLLRSAPGRIGYAVITATSRFLDRCRRRLEHISAVFPELSTLQVLVLEYYERAMPTAASDASQLVNAARSALSDIRQMYAAFREFSERERTASQATQLELPAT